MGKRNIARKLAGISAVEAAKEEALRLHLQAALDQSRGASPSAHSGRAPAPKAVAGTPAGGGPRKNEALSPGGNGRKPARAKRKSRQNRDLERALARGQAPENLPVLVPHMRGFSLYCLGYKKAFISRQLGVSWDTVADWEKAHDWETRRDAIQEEADRQRAVQIGAIQDLGHHTSVRILEHVADALGDVGDPGGPRPDAEDLRDYATAAEKAVKTVVPQEGAKVGVQVNIGEILADSRRFDALPA